MKGEKELNELKVVSLNGRLVTDSRDVAEMIGKEHKNLLADVRGYIETMKGYVGENGELKIQPSDFFIESTYTNTQNKNLPCYLLTKKGCDMVANKMTGQKGVLFTAAYVTKFEEMESQLSQPNIQQLSPELQMFKHLFDSMAQKQLEDARRDNEIKALTENVTAIKETFTHRDDNWRKSINRLINTAARNSGGNYKDLRSESYRILEERGRCNLNIRLANLKERLAESGATKTRINETTRMDVIESDARLKEIYTTIVKEFSINALPM